MANQFLNKTTAELYNSSTQQNIPRVNTRTAEPGKFTLCDYLIAVSLEVLHSLYRRLFSDFPYICWHGIQFGEHFLFERHVT